MGVEINRKFKDALFRKVFEEKKDLLSLYNALNNTEHTDEKLITVNTIEDVIYVGYKNDIAFVIDSELNLYEHQSSVNKNMPIRGLIYFAELYKGYIERNSLRIYNETEVKLPFPRYVVFYNGEKDETEKSVQRLADLFVRNEANQNQKPCLDVEVLLLNINYGCNKEIMNKCQKLMEYSKLIAMIIGKTADLAKKYSQNSIEKSKKEIFTEAVSLAIEEAISNNILRETLIKNKAEVTDMLLTEFDEKDYIEGVREEGERKGREEGREEGRNKMIYSLVEDKSISMEKGAQKLGISVEKLKDDMVKAGYKRPDID